MSDNRVIPEAAVEAAARGMLANSNWGDRWDELSELHKDWWRASATSALEAAAPHMSPSVDTSAIIAELRLFNHREAAALIERFASR